MSCQFRQSSSACGTYGHIMYNLHISLGNLLFVQIMKIIGIVRNGPESDFEVVFMSIASVGCLIKILIKLGLDFKISLCLVLCQSFEV